MPVQRGRPPLQRAATSSGRAADFGARGAWRHRAHELLGARVAVPASAVVATAVLYVVGGCGAISAALLPMSARTPTLFLVLVGVIELLIGGVLTLARHHVNQLVLQLNLVVRLITATVLAAHATSPAGLALVGLSFVSVAVFSAYFFARPLARTHAAFALAGFTAATLLGGIGDVTLVWLVITAAIVAGEEVLGVLVTQLRKQAATDALTGLANRSSFRLVADRELADAQRGRGSFTLALLDLDGFKAVNDVHGHLAGDALLVDLTQAWKSRLRSSDVLARYGGDEFALLFPATTPMQARAVLERLRAAHLMNWSAGVVCWTPGTTLDAMFATADRELYRAKEQRVRTTA